MCRAESHGTHVGSSSVMPAIIAFILDAVEGGAPKAGS
jgi:hypothetical protein